MQVEFVPSLCKTEKPVFEGHVVLETPSFDQRWAYIDQCGFQIDKEDKDGDMSSYMNNIGALRKMVKFTEPHYKSVALKHVEDGLEYKSFTDMCSDSACDPILFEVAGMFLRGFRPGKS